jgi:hypothetical protein
MAAVASGSERARRGSRLGVPLYKVRVFERARPPRVTGEYARVLFQAEHRKRGSFARPRGRDHRPRASHRRRAPLGAAPCGPLGPAGCGHFPAVS